MKPAIAVVPVAANERSKTRRRSAHPLLYRAVHRTQRYREKGRRADNVEWAAEAIAGALRAGPWYVDLCNQREVIVVFHGRIFRYDRADGAGRAEAVQYARLVGVPESQLDWR